MLQGLIFGIVQLKFLYKDKNDENVNESYRDDFGLVSGVHTQLCPTLCNSADCSPLGSSVPGILQTRIVEWVGFPAPGDLPDPGTEPMSLASPALAGVFFTTVPPGSDRVAFHP